MRVNWNVRFTRGQDRKFYDEESEENEDFQPIRIATCSMKMELPSHEIINLVKNDQIGANTPKRSQSLTIWLETYLKPELTNMNTTYNMI